MSIVDIFIPYIPWIHITHIFRREIIKNTRLFAMIEGGKGNYIQHTYATNLQTPTRRCQWLDFYFHPFPLFTRLTVQSYVPLAETRWSFYPMKIIVCDPLTNQITDRAFHVPPSSHSENSFPKLYECTATS